MDHPDPHNPTHDNNSNVQPTDQSATQQKRRNSYRGDNNTNNNDSNNFSKHLEDGNYHADFDISFDDLYKHVNSIDNSVEHKEMRTTNYHSSNHDTFNSNNDIELTHYHRYDANDIDQIISTDSYQSKPTIKIKRKQLQYLGHSDSEEQY
eukprot:CAMPEP_0170057984 /NCGR_PEP_ID=MMETSP0019_2-20121128/775_1 /TAXON_ID=98059 /ORGANISM="Dinobryon sp., Strain UTEXLB2267" /LENGTH=149 /DNA_ID=CAMNT_0010262807 /DNA_START=387 /DNA_END=836 /DNA_ORIENTATION=-